jgi:O-antigen/teichoic acid export membrane protein
MAKSLLIKNSIYGVIQLLLTAILTFVSVPLFIGKLGLELYGVWAVVAVVGNLNVLTNFGLNRALVVFVAQQGKSKESDLDIAITQIILFCLIGLFAIIVLVNKAFIVNTILSIPTSYSQDAQQLLVVLVIANGFLLLGQTFTSVIDANQKMYITNSCQFIYSLIYWVSQIVILYLGGGLFEIGLGALFAAIVWFFLLYVIYRKMWGKLNLEGLWRNFKLVTKKQIAYGSKIYISGLTGFLFEPLSKIFLSKFIGVDAVAIFEIGLKVKNQLNGFLVKLLNPLFPYIAQEKDDINLHVKINDLILKIQLVVIPITITLFFILKILIKLWLGTDNLDQITLFVVTMTVTLIMLQPSVLPVYQYLQSKNLAEKTIYVQLASVLVNALVFLLSYNIMGVYAILISNSLGLFAAYIMCNYYKYKYLHFSIIKELNYYIKLFMLSLILLIQCLLVRYYLTFNIWDLVIYPIIVVVSFVYLVRWLKLISANDLQRYFETMPYIKNKLSKLLIS